MPNWTRIRSKSQQRARRWYIFYHLWHILCLLCAILLTILTALAWRAETVTVGDFDLKATSHVCIPFFVASGLMVINVVIGCLALYLPHRPCFWIFFCIVLTILAVVIVIPSLIAIVHTIQVKTGAGSHFTYLTYKMKAEMEDYDGKNKNHKWNIIQEKYKCCGTENYKDWQDVQYGRTSLRVPISCCLPKFAKKDPHYCGLNILPHDDHASARIYDQGCLKPALKEAHIYLEVMGCFGLTFSFAYLAVGLLSCFLVVTKKID